MTLRLKEHKRHRSNDLRNPTAYWRHRKRAPSRSWRSCERQGTRQHGRNSPSSSTSSVESYVAQQKVPTPAHEKGPTREGPRCGDRLSFLSKEDELDPGAGLKAAAQGA